MNDTELREFCNQMIGKFKALSELQIEMQYETIDTKFTEWELKKLIFALDVLRITADRKTENSSEKPNNCEHITEDGVTCAKYPACDDCLDNPLNKVKGSERLLKGKTEPQTITIEGKMPLNEWRKICPENPQFKDEPQTDTHDICTETHECVKDTHDRIETMSCQECKWWFTDSLKHGGYCQSLLYNHECRYEPEVDCSWK